MDALSPQRLGRAPCRRDVLFSPRRRLSGQPPELLALVCSHHPQWREVRGVNRALRDAEPMAWDFCVNFARDNDLQVVEACLVPDTPPPADVPNTALPPKKA
jgi:hypothetical protein